MECGCSHFAAACRTGTCMYSPVSVRSIAVGFGLVSCVFCVAPDGDPLVFGVVAVAGCSLDVLGIIVGSSCVSGVSVSLEVSDCSVLGTAKLIFEFDPMAWSKRATDIG